MPVKSVRNERPIIRLFLSAYENDGWRNCALDWVEDAHDSAIEVLATKADGTTLALEHTLIQPFVGEKFDSERFLRAFSRIENNPNLIVPGRDLDLAISVGALPTGYDWNAVGHDLLSWLSENHAAFSEGDSEHLVSVVQSSRKGPLKLRIAINVTSVPGLPGHCFILRNGVQQGLGSNVEEALRRKLPKLVNTLADIRILLFERDQPFLSDMNIYDEVKRQRSAFPYLAKVNEIWFANTVVYKNEEFVSFALVDDRGLRELLNFKDGTLTKRRRDPF